MDIRPLEGRLSDKSFGRNIIPLVWIMGMLTHGRQTHGVCPLGEGVVKRIKAHDQFYLLI